MQIAGPNEQPVRDEYQVMLELLPLSHARVLELGCGAAAMTQALAERTDVEHIVGAEVDTLAHEKNLIKAIDRVSFARFGAEEIEADDASFDMVIMLKSLHHVPAELMSRAFAEIHRVLKPGAVAYISEPVFAGELNEVIRLFHDEQGVRSAAFGATQDAIRSGHFELVREYFYLSPVAMRSFDQFEQGVMRATHTEHHLTDALVDEIRKRFEAFKGEDSSTPYRFESPIRVDLLRKVA
jgi:ubiquinone/menaquinone biosynthesis C-methylase UbiE